MHTARQREQKRGRNAVHTRGAAYSLFEGKCVRYVRECRSHVFPLAHDSLSLQSPLTGLGRIYANTARTMKVIALKFGWLIFIPTAQLPPDFHSNFFSLRRRMIAKGDDNDLLYHSFWPRATARTYSSLSLFHVRTRRRSFSTIF